MPIDMRLWNLVQENKAAVVRESTTHGTIRAPADEDTIYTPEGEWSYERFENWLVGTGVTAWPRLDSGRLDVGGDAFRLMYHEPGVESLHALRDSLGVIVKAKLPIGRDGRNRPSLFPFCTATGRNAHSQAACTTPTPAYAFVHEVPTGQDRRLSGLADAGSRCRSRHVGRSGPDRGISQR